MYPFSISLKSVSTIVSEIIVHPLNTYTIIDHGILEERYLLIGLQLCQETELTSKARASTHSDVVAEDITCIHA